jgi:hypothetical protein
VDLRKLNGRLAEVEKHLGVSHACHCWPPRIGGEICPDGHIINFGPCPRCGGKGPLVPISEDPRQTLLNKLEDIARKAGIENRITEHLNDPFEVKRVHDLLVEFINRNKEDTHE